MSLKRPHDSSPPNDRERKRRQFSASLPVTPAASHISLSTPLRTPFTTYPPRPFDSPHNPFGRKWANYVTRVLPAPTLFSKHLVLRLQFIRTGSAGSLYGGVYRIVQVPLSFTFTHLRCFITWLFCGLSGQTESDKHLFEVKKKVKIYSFMYKPGQVKSGQTWAKISNTQDPYRWRKNSLSEGQEEDELSSDVDEDEDVQSGDGESEDCGDEGQGDWEWKDEEDFTLAHTWPKGPEVERAIIYHHSPVTQIHITINQTYIPKRRGKSNTPHVFSAHGRVWLSPPPLPRPVFAIPAKKLKSPGHKRKPSPTHSNDEDTDEDYEETAERRDSEAEDRDTEEASETGSETEDDDDHDKVDDIDLELDADYWNGASNSFAKFLSRYMGSALPESSPSSSRVPTAFDHEEEYLSEGDTLLYPSTPGLTRSSSVPSSPGPTLATSSPSRASSCAPVHIVSPSKSDTEDNGGYVTLSLPALTPFPAKARPIRKQMKRIEKRMGKMKKGKWLCENDEGEENDENDELVEDEGNENAAPKLDEIVGKRVRIEETEPPDWDPFGDEEEL